MKATFEIPDDLYRRAKARSALEGRPLRSVAIELFESWLNNEPAPEGKPAAPSGNRQPTRFDNAPWVKIARRHVKPGASHDLDEIREAAARGWAAETSSSIR